MSNHMKVPEVVRQIFDVFPLKEYEAIEYDDKSMELCVAQNSYEFRGPNSTKNSAEDTFTLCVYDSFQEKSSGLVLASDPWCLFAQFAVAEKSELQMPSFTVENTVEKKMFKHKMIDTSYFSSQNLQLPMLLQGNKKRYVISTQMIMESIRAKFVDYPEYGLYLSYLDVIFYDAWIAQVVFQMGNDDFHKLYSNSDVIETKLVNQVIFQNMKRALLKRNNFHLRNNELFSCTNSTLQIYGRNRVNELVQPLLKEFQNSLILFEKAFKNENSVPFLKSSTELTYFKLYLSSYILCCMNLPDNTKLHQLVSTQCPSLIKQAQQLLLTRDICKNNEK